MIDEAMKSRIDKAVDQLELNAQMRGLFEGLETGLECGEYRTIRNFTLRLLRHRCGALPKEIEEQVYELPDECVYSLAEAMFDFSSQEDLRNWLEAKMRELWLRRCDALTSFRVLG